MPAKAGSVKPERRYGHLKESLKKQGKSDALAEQLAAQAVDRRRAPRRESDSSPRDDMASHAQEEARRHKR